MKRIMLDLETLGQTPGSVITSLGAVCFGGGAIGERFYQRIDIQSSLDLGLQVDASTVLWWMRQPDATRIELDKPGIQVLEALKLFSAWTRRLQPDLDFEMWGNGSDFDNALLATAYTYAGIKIPWKYGNNRCYRTAKNFWRHIGPPEFSGIKHNAADDAAHQARHLMLMRPDF